MTRLQFLADSVSPGALNDAITSAALNVHINRIRLIPILTLTAAGVASCFAPGGAPRTISGLVTMADAIVIATVLSGNTTAGTSTFTLDVERTLKGDVRPRTVVQVRWTAPAESPVPNGPMLRERGLFFLKEQGGWVVIPTQSGYVPDVGSTYYTLPSQSNPSGQGMSIIENVLLELAAGIEAGGGRPGAGVYDLAAEYRRHPSLALKPVLQRFVGSSSSRLRMIGFSALLATGDIPALIVLEQNLGSLAGTPALGQSVDAIRWYWTNSDVQSVVILGRLVRSAASLDLRTAAATALARIHTRESLPYLAELLDSSNLLLRTLGVGGLAMFANNVPIGDSTPAAGEWKYRTEETITYSTMSPEKVGQDPSIVNFWKSWWTQHRNELSR